MIVVRFSGGLGNQISQYAFSRLLYHINSNRVIKYDCSYYDQVREHNGFELSLIFKNIKIDEVTNLELFKVARVVQCKYVVINSVLKNIFHNKENIYTQNYVSTYPEDIKLLCKDFDDKYLIGVFHNYNYDSIIDTLREELSFPVLDDVKNKNVLNNIRIKNSVSIHVRKGDYEKYNLDILGIDYYKRAIEIISSKVENPYFFIFSDDSLYIRTNFTFLKDSYEIIDWNKNINSYKDMQLMSECKHNIIANSTFSYWAAYLNKNVNKIVIRPKYITKDRLSWSKDEWISI